MHGVAAEVFETFLLVRYRRGEYLRPMLLAVNLSRFR
jgi:hypothetical protein